MPAPFVAYPVALASRTPIVVGRRTWVEKRYTNIGARPLTHFGVAGYHGSHVTRRGRYSWCLPKAHPIV